MKDILIYVYNYYFLIDDGLVYIILDFISRMVHVYIYIIIYMRSLIVLRA